MPQTSPRQRKTTGRVMHEFKHGELKSGPGGKGGKVKSRRQAIAIALGRPAPPSTKARARTKESAKTERKEARGETYQQEREGKSHVGARGRRESSRGMGGKNATKRTAKGKKLPDPGRGTMAARQSKSFTAGKGAGYRRTLEDEQASTRDRTALSYGGGG